MIEPLRTAAAPYRRWWAGASRDERIAGAVAFAVVALLAGAFLFGVWHVIGGGLVKGNWRAGRFGIALAAGTAALLGVGHLKLAARFRR